MAREKLCRVCETPELIGHELKWGDNGVISLRRSPRNRMVLFEAAVIDNLFRGIEELIGLEIAHIVIESRRREVRRYIEGSFPAWMRRSLMFLNESLGEKPLLREPVGRIRNRVGKPLARRVFDIGRVYGYGDVRLGPLWESLDLHPWRVNLMRKPYSVLFFAAEEVASVEAFEGRDHWVRFEETGDDIYRYTAYPCEHPIELKGFLARRRYEFKPGDVSFDRCPGCGVPLPVASLEWDLEDGTIHDPESGRRMAFFGPHSIDAVLHDLQSELGESVPELAVEAQRRYVKSRVAGGNWRRSRETFGAMAALRGLGNITRFEADEKHLGVTVQNSCLHELVIGMAQAIYEIATGRERTSYEWGASDDGDLNFTVMA